MLRAPSLPVLILLVALAIAAALLPATGSLYAVKFGTRLLIAALFVMSLDLLIGITGLVSFGHAAFFGLGAYAVFFLSPEEAGAFVPLALVAGAALGGAAALVIGAFAVRTQGFAFIMVTLAAAQMLFALFHDTRIAGGSDGASIAIKPEIMIGERVLFAFAHPPSLYYIALALLVLAYLGCLALARSPFGRVLQGIRANETRMAALGFNTYAAKLGAFAIAGALAGLAGALSASVDGFVPPELLSWRQSGTAIMMLVLGGSGQFAGAIFGAVVYSLAEEILKSSSLVGDVIAQHWAIPMGLLLIAVVLAAPQGIVGWLPRRAARVPASGPPSDANSDARSTATLAVEGLSRVFGGLIAVDGVDVSFPPNRIHAVIGPNGAGKTTFANLLSGALAPSAGRVLLDGADITALPVHARARRGIGRSFQRTTVMPGFTLWENCTLAAQAQALSPAARDAAVAAALAATGLSDQAAQRADAVSHGAQRQLEIAMLLASGARVLILDEPLAGTGPEETQRVTALLRRLTRDHTIILIEHDMDAVFAVADTITVLVNGQLIAHGPPAAVRADAQVRAAYLGDFALDGDAP